MSTSTVAQGFRASGYWRTEPRTHILLRSLPRTALPSDVRRAILRAKVVGVSEVAIDYTRFLPSGRAYLTLTHTDCFHQNIFALRNLTIGGIPVFAQGTQPPIATQPPRARGPKGRSEAAGRGVITGTGPHGGLLNPGKNVVLWGLPGRALSDDVKNLLKGFGLAGTDGGRQEVMKVEGGDRRFTMVSRFLVRLASVSEAHRLVRLLHMSYFEREKQGQKYQIRARVIY